MPDQGHSERPTAKEGPPRIQVGQEIKVRVFYSYPQTPKVIFGRAPRRTIHERFKGDKNVYAYLPNDRTISRSQLVITPEDKRIYIENPTQDKKIWVSVKKDRYDPVSPGEKLSLPNNTQEMRNLKILFARRSPQDPGYLLEATAVAGSPVKALGRLRLSKD